MTVAPKRMSALQKLRGARDILDIAIDHVERAHVGDSYKRRGVREQAFSAIGHAATLVAEAYALFAVEVLRAPIADPPNRTDECSSCGYAPCMCDQQ